MQNNDTKGIMSPKVLLIGTPYMGIYKDIIQGLEDLGFFVEYIPQKNYPNNPYYLHKKSSHSKKKEFQSFLLNYWKEQLDHRNCEELYFDYLLVINGLNIHPYLFEKLRNANKSIIAVNYIYDRIKGVYQIDHNFKYFDRIYSFDQSDVSYYHLNLLPIFWVPISKKTTEEMDIFAFGAYDPTRVKVFKKMKEIADKANLRGIIKLYYPKVENSINYTIGNFLRILFHRRKRPSLKDLRSDFYTFNTLSTDLFRQYINSSKVVVDTNHSYQDGLTARCMWALGAGKKIITNNQHITNYSFYSKEQVLIFNMDVSDEMIVDFIKQDCKVSHDCRSSIDEYRIDNWLKKILGLGM